MMGGLGVEDLVLGAAIALVVAAVTTPAGVSGAVVLLPAQVSLLHVPSPALTPTNLLYNVIATPGALLRFGREGRLRSPLLRRLLYGTVPGVVCGAAIRVEWLADARDFMLVVALVLAPLGAWLTAGRKPRARRAVPAGWVVTSVGFAAGLVGGIYGIGGGSLIGPALALGGVSMLTLAPAALACTWVTSLVGVVAFQVFAWFGATAAAPRWDLGIAMGLAGTVGSYVGARLQTRVPELALRRLLGVVCVALAIRYAFTGLD